MIFENLSDKLQNALGKLRGKGKLSEKDIDVAMKEIKIALLEADVNYMVVKDFVKSVKEKSLGERVMESLTPGQQVVKIVNEELTRLMGEKEAKLEVSSKLPTIIMLCGLQGAGKTTHAGKIALFLKKQNKKPLLVAADIYRPAAIKQLQVVGKKVGSPVFSMGDKENPVKIAEEGIKEAEKSGYDTVIIDTAGRLHIDEDLMEEIKNIKAAVNPTEILLTVDSMTGQDAVNVAKTFNDALDITGVILTKLDGDTRGGAALSVRSVTGKPIKFIGVGEKLDDLELFYPERMASRILGMGDVLSLIEKAQKAIDEKEAKALEEKIRSQTYDFNDFLNQLAQMRNLGPLENILGMLPGVNSKMLKGLKIDENEIKKIEAMIYSMTKEERSKPDIIDNSRKERIARGSGQPISELNKLIKQFKESKKMMKKFSGMGNAMKKRGKFKMPFFK